MTKPTEIDVMKTIDEQLGGLDDIAARQRILRWATEKFFGAASGAAPVYPAAANTALSLSGDGRVSKKAQKSKGPAATSLAIVKDLNLKPTGKTSFKDFVAAKAPASNPEKCLVAVYYLKNELALDKVGIGHVYTCFKVEGWRVPSDLANTLQWAASQEGWFDTKERENIKLTMHGENYVEHDMQKKTAVRGKA